MDVQALGVDYLTVVGHKFYAPRIGALYVRNCCTPASVPVLPMFLGGGQERGIRAGTENTGMIAGLGMVCWRGGGMGGSVQGFNIAYTLSPSRRPAPL